MTVFATGNIPASVNTLERLVAWANGAFYALHRNTEYQESDGGILVPIITAQDGKAGDDTERIIFRTSIRLNSDWRETASAFWASVPEISSAAIPTKYLP